jgi:hypothetical protein
MGSGLSARKLASGDSLLIISPGGGIVGSLSWRFMRTTERRLPAEGDC